MWRRLILRWSVPRAMQAFQLMRLGAVLLTSVLLAKTGLSTAEIGVYEMMLYIGTTLSFFWVSGLLQGIPPVYSQMEQAGDKERLLAQAFITFNILAITVAGGLYAFRYFTVPALTGLPELPYLNWFCLYLGFNLPSFIVEYIYLMRQRASGIVAWGVLAFSAQIAAVVLPILMGYGLLGGLVGLAVLAMVKWCWTLVLVSEHLLEGINLPVARAYLIFSAPLILNVLAGNLILLFDNWLVGFTYQSEEIFAIYRYGSRELPLATALATALSVSMIPKLTTDPQAGMAELKQRGTRLMHLVFPITFLFIFISKPLFPLVFNPDFADSADLFNIYLMITASRLLLPNALVLARGKPGVIFRVGLFELFIKVVLGFWMISTWGLTGLAWSAVIAFMVEKLALIAWLEYQGTATRSWLHLKVYVPYVVAMVVAYAFSLSI